MGAATKHPAVTFFIILSVFSVTLLFLQGCNSPRFNTIVEYRAAEKSVREEAIKEILVEAGIENPESKYIDCIDGVLMKWNDRVSVLQSLHAKQSPEDFFDFAVSILYYTCDGESFAATPKERLETVADYFLECLTPDDPFENFPTPRFSEIVKGHVMARDFTWNLISDFYQMVQDTTVKRTLKRPGHPLDNMIVFNIVCFEYTLKDFETLTRAQQRDIIVYRMAIFLNDNIEADMQLHLEMAANCGVIWFEFGHEILEKEEIRSIPRDTLIEELDYLFLKHIWLYYDQSSLDHNLLLSPEQQPEI